MPFLLEPRWNWVCRVVVRSTGRPGVGLPLRLRSGRRGTRIRLWVWFLAALLVWFLAGLLVWLLGWFLAAFLGWFLGCFLAGLLTGLVFGIEQVGSPDGESPSWLRHRILIPAFEGSNPSSPATPFKGGSAAALAILLHEGCARSRPATGRSRSVPDGWITGTRLPSAPVGPKHR